MSNQPLYTTAIIETADSIFKGTKIGDAVVYTSQYSQALYLGPFPNPTTNPNNEASFKLQDSSIIAFTAMSIGTSNVPTNTLDIGGSISATGDLKFSGNLVNNGNTFATSNLALKSDIATLSNQKYNVTGGLINGNVDIKGGLKISR